MLKTSTTHIKLKKKHINNQNTSRLRRPCRGQRHLRCRGAFGARGTFRWRVLLVLHVHAIALCTLLTEQILLSTLDNQSTTQNYIFNEIKNKSCNITQSYMQELASCIKDLQDGGKSCARCAEECKQRGHATVIPPPHSGTAWCLFTFTR